MLADESLFAYLDAQDIAPEVQSRIFKTIGATWAKLERIGREYDDQYIANYLIEHDILVIEPVMKAIREAPTRTRTKSAFQEPAASHVSARAR